MSYKLHKRSILFLSVNCCFSFFCFLIPSMLSSVMASNNVTTFNAAVPFNCLFSGGSELVNMEFSRNGSHGIMLGTSDTLMMQSNQVPRLNVSLNTILAPYPISFRGVWVKSNETNLNLQYKTSSSLANTPIEMTLPVSKFRDNGYVAGQPYGLNLTVSANLRWAYPNEQYKWQVVLTCLAP